MSKSASDLSIADMHRMQCESDYYGFVATPYGRLFLGGSDDGIALRYHNAIPYEPQSLAKWQELCAGKKVVIDVGAHTGIYTLAAFQAGAEHVISVEPNARNVTRLILNLRANGYPFTGCLQRAAWDDDGVEQFTVQDHAFYLNTGGCVLDTKAQGKTYSIRTVRLDTALDDDPLIGAIKIDVEGNVSRVLAGMPHILMSHPPLIIEREDGIVDVLAGYGYEVRSVLDERNLYCVAA